MPVFVVGREKSLAALDRRLFRANVSEAAMARVRKAIRDENPEVDFDDLQPGLVLKLPKLPELKARTDLAFDEGVGEAVAATRDQLEADVKELAATAIARMRTDAADRQVLAKQLSGREVKDTAAQDPSVAAALESALAGIAEDDRAEEATGAAVKQAVAEWSEGLQSLDRLLP